jgi:diguanylate cyclase (GGDEF)-like protein
MNDDGLLSDDLTGLRNRFSLKEHLERMVDSAPASGPRPALLLLDLDEFASVNDRFGHLVGDEVLRVTGGRLLTAASRHGTAFRSGGDEFVLLLDPTTADEAIAVAEQVLRCVHEPVEAEGISVQISTSISVVMLGDRHRADGVLRDADVTMYRAKATGGKRVEVYTQELDDWVRARRQDVDGLAKEVQALREENRALTEAITIDARTGLPNRVAFDADHLQVHALRSRSGECYSVLLADIDQFHEYNEHFGMAAGDEALRSVAQCIKDTVRQGDRAYYYGGDVFAVLLLGADLRAAVIGAERVRSRVEELAIEHPTNPSGVVTVTAAVVAGGFRHATINDVVEEVIVLLLEGKHAGRNRVVWPR